MGRLEVELCGQRLDNPIIPASGTFGYGREFAELYDLNILGSISIKGTTENPRFGNPTPRIAECSAGMLNSVGLQNPGIDKVIEDELPNLSKLFRKKVIANISGFSEEEYVRCCEKISECENVGIIEVNISCPNVKCGGMSFGTSAGECGKNHKGGKARYKKTGIYEAFAERYGYNRNCARMRKRRCGRNQHGEHIHGNED